MRKFLIVVLLVTVSSSFAQNTVKEVVKSKAEMVYETAKKYNDAVMMRSAIYDLILADPQSSWKDTLAYVYFRSGEYVSTVLVTSEILKAGKKDNILELKALSEQQLGLVKDALSSYEELFKNTGKNYFLYQVATIQYQLKRFGECEMTVNALINDAKSVDEKVVISLGKQQQEVSMLAALHNIKGVMYKELGKIEEAKKSFNKASELAPEFVLPQANLNVIAKEEAAAKETTQDTETSKKKKKK